MSATDIYLDHAATTPVDPRVLEVMLPFFSERFGNPSSIYMLGRDARAGLDWARTTLASLLHCDARDLIMTSGATESNNLAIKGVAWWHHFRDPARNHIIISAIEHHAVLHAAEALRPHGFDVTIVAPDHEGIIHTARIAAAIRPTTCLISVMLANNEIGTLQPVREIADLAHAHGVTIHTDAVQAAGAVPIDIADLGVDLLSLTAHKFYGPKGTGLLFARQGCPILWQQDGGAQENTRRAGTENTPGIIGMAAALLLATQEQDARNAHLLALRNHLTEGILERVPGSRLNGHATQRLPNNVNIAFDAVEGEILLQSLDMRGIAASSGSACSTGSTEPSHVLLALGLAPETARGSLRLTVGKDNTIEQIDRAITIIADTVAQVRALSPAPH